MYISTDGRTIQSPESFVPQSEIKPPKPPSLVPAPTASQSPQQQPTSAQATQIPKEGHPIDWLIRDANKEWEARRTQRSKSFKDVVKRYRIKHGRHPPPDFDLVSSHSKHNSRPFQWTEV